MRCNLTDDLPTKSIQEAFAIPKRAQVCCQRKVAHHCGFLPIRNWKWDVDSGQIISLMSIYERLCLIDTLGFHPVFRTARKSFNIVDEEPRILCWFETFCTYYFNGQNCADLIISFSSALDLTGNGEIPYDIKALVAMCLTSQSSKILSCSRSCK